MEYISYSIQSDTYRYSTWVEVVIDVRYVIVIRYVLYLNSDFHCIQAVHFCMCCLKPTYVHTYFIRPPKYLAFI
jgi:hypothetical protein